MPSTLQRSDYENYLIRLHFGSGRDWLQACLRRAYLDFNRTLHGIGNRSDLYKSAVETLLPAFAIARNMDRPTQAQFDEWHRNTCKVLASAYREHGYPSFFVGQGQKWLNMTFKYIYTMGEQRLPGFRDLYDFCHVPLDNILMKALVNDGFPALPCAWSRLDNYKEYLERQNWVRTRFPNRPPLDVEFDKWNSATDEG